MNRRFYFAAAWAVFLLSASPALRAQERSLKTPPPPQSEPQRQERKDDPRKRQAWFYEQRAYPHKRIPANARLKALEQVYEMDRARRARQAQAAEAILGPSGTWFLIGPGPSNAGSSVGAVSGRVSALAVDPTNPDIAYLGGAQGGVWKTFDGGLSWSPLTDNQASLAVGSIAIDPSACTPGPCTTIYVGTGEQVFSGDSYYGAGILKSVDGGSNWTQLPGPFVGPFGLGTLSGGAQIGSLVVNAANRQILLAGVRIAGRPSAESGVFRSVDGGVNWTLVLPGAPATEVFFDPGNPSVAWASLGNIFGDTDNGIYRSTDTGATWARVTGVGLPAANLGRIEMAIAPSSPSTIYASIADSSTVSDDLLGVFRTTNGGTTWTNTNAPDFCTPQCWYDQVIRVHPTDANVVYAGGSAAFDAGRNASVYLIRSADGGSTWNSIVAGTNNVRPHVDQHAMAFGFTGNSATRLYIGNDGGVWSADVSSPTGAINWANRNGTLSLTQFYPGHSIHPSSEDVGFGGTQDNGTQKYMGDVVWQTVTCGDGGWTAIDPFIPSTVYSTCQEIDIRKSFQNGDRGTFGFADSGIDPTDLGAFIPPFVHDPNASGRLYFGTFRVWRTTNGAESWTAVSPDLTGGVGVLRTIAVAPSDSNVVYTGSSNGRVHLSLDATIGAPPTWTDSSTGLPNRSITQIAVDPVNPMVAYVAFSGFAFDTDLQGHVFKTDNGGAAWRDVSCSVADCRTPGVTDLPNTPVNDIVIDLDIPGTLYVATDVGVFVSADDGATWSSMQAGLPRVAVFSLKLRRASRTLRAATHGRSVWDFQLSGLPAFHLRSISPTTAPRGSGDVALTVRGGGFSSSAVVQLNGADLPTSFNSPELLFATIPAADLAGGQYVAQITVVNPAPFPGTSNAVPFTVTSPVPILSSISPNTTSVNSPDTVITLTGANFFADSVARFNGVDLATMFDSSTQLHATIPAAQLATGGFFPVTVFSPPPGGGITSPQLFTVTAPAPPNDNFVNAILTGTTPFTDMQNNVGATTETNDPNPGAVSTCAGAGRFHTIWYRFTPTSNGIVIADTNGSVYDTVLSVWTGAAGSLVNVACDDDGVAPGGASRLSFNATANVTYHFMVSGFGATDGGATVFHSVFLAPPPNDNFANASVVTAIPFTDMVNTVAATTETIDPAPSSTCTSGAANNGRAKSIWYRYTAGGSGTATMDTFNSDYDTILAVFTGSPGAFTEVACNDDTGGIGVPSQVTFGVTSGTQYHIMVTDWSGFGGNAVVHFTAGPQPGPDFAVTANPTTVTVTRGQTGTSTISVAPSNGFASAVTLTCSGLPALSTCIFNPVSVTPGANPATSSLTITTTAGSSVAPQHLRRQPPLILYWLLAFALLLLLWRLRHPWSALGGLRASVQRPVWMASGALLVVLALLLLQLACGGGGGGNGGGGGGGTPRGTFTVTVSGTSGTTARTTTVTLTVN